MDGGDKPHFHTKIACISVLMQAMCCVRGLPYSLQSSSQSTVLLFTRAD